MRLFGNKTSPHKDMEAELIQIIEKNQAQFYRIAYSYVKQEHDALDVLQEAIVKAIGSSGHIKEEQYIKSWFVRILINTAIDHRRKMDKIDFIDEIGPFEKKADEVERELVLDLREALESLEMEQRAIIELRYFEDLSLKEIANVLGQPLSTVKSTLYRTLKQLRLSLEEEVQYES